MTQARAPYFLFAGLYFIQGAMLAYISNFQKPYLTSAGTSVREIALLSSAMLVPFVLKIFMGILSDRINFFGYGHRKPYMALGLGVASLCFFFLAKVNPGTNFPTFFTLMVTSALGMALFDTCADGFAIDTASDNEESIVQTYMMIGKSVGYIILSTLFGWLVAKSGGYSDVFYVISVLVFCVLVWAMLIAKEPVWLEKEKQDWNAFFRSLGIPYITFAIYAILYSICSFGIDGLVTLYMAKEMHASGEVIGHYGSAHGIGSIAGAALAGWSVRRFGHKTIAFAAIFALILGGIAVGILNRPEAALVVGILWGLTWGYQETVFVILSMMMSERELSATIFASFMMFSNFGISLGEGIATTLTAQWGFQPVFFCLALGNLVVLPLLWLLYRPAKSV